VTELLINEKRDLQDAIAQKSSVNIMTAEVAEKIAERIKDGAALEKASMQKLAAQRDFAAAYKAKFPNGVNVKWKGSDSTVLGSTGDDWCLSMGFHVRTVRRWCDLLSETKYTEKKNAIIKKCWSLLEMWQAANFSSNSIEWYKPENYIEAVRAVLGEIDLDPASNPEANRWIGAKTIYTDEQNGLTKPWAGRVFMNPPYGKTDNNDSLAGAFCQKAIAQYEAGCIDACIILVNSLHSQTWQAPLYDYSVCFVNHRIQFISGDGEKNKNPTFQNIFVYLGPDEAKFATEFAKFGYVMKKFCA